MRPLKTTQELIQEGYNAEAAVAFLHDFLEAEKDKQFNLLLNCPAEELKERRAIFKYIKQLEQLLITKVQVGIENATEQFRKETRRED